LPVPSHQSDNPDPSIDRPQSGDPMILILSDYQLFRDSILDPSMARRWPRFARFIVRNHGLDDSNQSLRRYSLQSSSGLNKIHACLIESGPSVGW
jgi:hypothetical protein